MATGVKGVAPADALCGKPAPTKRTMRQDCLCGILRAGRRESTNRRGKPGDTLIPPNETHQESSYQPSQGSRWYLCLHASPKTPALVRSCTTSASSAESAPPTAAGRTTKTRSPHATRPASPRQASRRRRFTRFRSCALPATFLDTTKPKRGVPASEERGFQYKVRPAVSKRRRRW